MARKARRGALSYYELSRLNVVFRPIDKWPQEFSRHRRRAPFRAQLSATVALLARELRMLNAKRVVLQIAIGESALRHDGLPYADARTEHPGVILAFESKWGPLKYATDEFSSWQENLRAIALAMEALRKVDRYGVSKRGEQYTGWRALPVSTDAAESIQTREQAQAVLDEYGGDVRRALRETHPDAGGDETEFRKVVKARDLLNA
jgi:hypothetical protein